VLATLSPERQFAFFETMTMHSIESLKRSLTKAKEDRDVRSLEKLSGDLQILGALPRSYTNAVTSLARDSMHSGCDTSPDMHSPLSAQILAVVYRGWPLLSEAASSFGREEVRSTRWTWSLSIDDISNTRLPVG
jgi:hypothetical protein